jgi:hypothetical protein
MGRELPECSSLWRSLDAALAAINMLQHSPQMDAIQQELVRTKGRITSFSLPVIVNVRERFFTFSPSNLTSQILPTVVAALVDAVHFTPEFIGP